MTKKDKAFKLFDEGKNASSPEVKALKLKGRTKYNYYRDWKIAKGAVQLHQKPLVKQNQRVRPRQSYPAVNLSHRPVKC